MKFFQIFLLIGLLGFVSACDNTETITQTKLIETPRLNPNLPPAVNLDKINWKVYDKEGLSKLTLAPGDVVLFTVTPDQAEKLGKNQVDIQRYILQLKETVIFYQNQNKTVDSKKNPK